VGGVALALSVRAIARLAEAGERHLLGRESPGRIHLGQLEIRRVRVVVGDGPADDDGTARGLRRRGLFDLTRELVDVRGNEVAHADPHEIAGPARRDVRHAGLGQRPVELGNDAERLGELVAAAQRVQERGVHRVHAVVLHLEPVAGQRELRGRHQPVAGHVVAVEDRERRASLRRAEIGEDEARELHGRIRTLPDSLLEPAPAWLSGSLEAPSVAGAGPAVIAATDAAIERDVTPSWRPSCSWFRSTWYGPPR